MRKIKNSIFLIVAIILGISIVFGMIDVKAVQAATVETINLSQLNTDRSGDGWSFDQSTGVLLITSGCHKLTTGGTEVKDKRVVISGDSSINASNIEIRVETLVINRYKLKNCLFKDSMF